MYEESMNTVLIQDTALARSGGRDEHVRKVSSWGGTGLDGSILEMILGDSFNTIAARERLFACTLLCFDRAMSGNDSS